MAIIDMIRMDGEAWAAWGVLALGVVSSIGAVCLHSISVAFKMGYFKRCHEDIVKRVDKLEVKQEETEEKLSELRIINMKLDDMSLNVRNLRRDIVRLLRGKINPDALTRAEDEDDVDERQ